MGPFRLFRHTFVPNAKLISLIQSFPYFMKPTGFRPGSLLFTRNQDLVGRDGFLLISLGQTGPTGGGMRGRVTSQRKPHTALERGNENSCTTSFLHL